MTALLTDRQFQDALKWVGLAALAGVIGTVCYVLLTRYTRAAWRAGKRVRLRAVVQPVPPLEIDSLPGMRQRRQAIARTLRRRRRVSVVGPSGDGKSSAVYSYYVRGRRFRRLVWISFGPDGPNRQDIRVALDILRSPTAPGALPDALDADFARATSRARRTLVVLDGADDLSAVRALLPARIRRSSRVLVTTQSPDLKLVGFHNVTLPSLTHAECVGYLARGHDFASEDLARIGQMIEAVEAFPLAIRRLALALGGRAATPASLAMRLAHEGPEAVLDVGHPLEGHHTVVESFLATVSSAVDLAPSSTGILEVLAAFSSAPVPLDLVRDSCGIPDSSFDAGLESLHSFSFFIRDESGARSDLSVHPFLWRLSRGLLSPVAPAVLKRCLAALAQVAPSQAWDPSYWRDVERVRPHALELLAQCATMELETPSLIAFRDVARAMGRYEWATGDYDQALATFDMARNAARTLHCLGLVDTPSRGVLASLVNDTGVNCSSLGQTHEALQCHQEAAAIWADLGDDYALDVLFARTGASCCLRDLGHFDAARDLVESALEDLNSNFTDCPERLWALTALGTSLVQSGDESRRPLEMLNEVLEARRHRFGQRHIDTARSHYAVSRAHRLRGEFSPAAKSAEACVDIRATVLGRRHPLTLRARTSLALAEAADGNHAAARRIARGVAHELQGIESRATRAPIGYWVSILDDQSPDTLLSDARRWALEAFREAPIVREYDPVPSLEAASTSRVL